MEDHISPKSTGLRLKRLRSITGLSRRAFSSKHGIPSGTMQNWEDGRYGGLTRRGAERVLTALSGEGIECHIEWLLIGKGPVPFVPGFTPELTSANEFSAGVSIHDIEQLSETQIISKELAYFHSLNLNATDNIVTDDSMMPLFLPGDFVAGKRNFSDGLIKALDSPCIVQFSNRQVLIRLLCSGNRPGLYSLKATNLHSTAENKHVIDIELLSAAPIIWCRRKDPARSKS